MDTKISRFTVWCIVMINLNHIHKSVCFPWVVVSSTFDKIVWFECTCLTLLWPNLMVFWRHSLEWVVFVMVVFGMCILKNCQFFFPHHLHFCVQNFSPFCIFKMWFIFQWMDELQKIFEWYRINWMFSLLRKLFVIQNITTWPLAVLHAYKFPLLSVASPHSLWQFFKSPTSPRTWKYWTNYPLLVNIDILWRRGSLMYT